MQHINVDIIIIGGGIAGLWTLNRLCSKGYNAILFEQGDLGGGQTIVSQGMIHGGIKYALGGALTGSSEAIADMPDHWRSCLRGEGDVDLRSAEVLSDHFYMWSTQSLTSRLTSFFASKVSRGRVDTVRPPDRPEVFKTSQFKGNLYKLVDLVLDVPSILRALMGNCEGRIFSIDWQQCEFQRDDGGSISQLQISNSLSISSQQIVFAAGEGNEKLLADLKLDSPAMQRRPLKQVLVKHDYDYSLYAHCMGANPSPRLTISSHRAKDGKMVWYLGGDLATEGVKLDDDALISKAKNELSLLFPWLDFGASEWATMTIDRAEPKQKGLLKPDQAFVVTAPGCDNVIVAWPTKLTLAPNMADQVDQLLVDKKIVAKSRESLAALRSLAVPKIASPCWETAFDGRVFKGKDQQ